MIVYKPLSPCPQSKYPVFKPLAIEAYYLAVCFLLAIFREDRKIEKKRE
jgi:hypothetical protein